MNKKSWKYLVPCMAFALCSVAFTSCGDDDEGGPTPQGPTTTFAGKLPTQVGSYTFHYDDNGRCTRVSSSYGNVLEIDYKRNIIMTDGEDDYMNITFNSKGYITKMSGSWNYSEGGEYEKGSGTVTFKYDGDGHLTTYSGTSKESYSFDGEKYSYTGYGNVSCTWRGGNLVSAEYTYEETENGDKDTETEDYTITYDETSDNETRQCPMALNDIFGDDMYLLSIVGLYGEGPAQLPERIECVGKDNYGSSYTDITNAAYGLNADGTIDWESLNGYRYDYSYTTFSSDDNAETAAYNMAKAMQAGQKKLRVRDFFMPKRNRK